MLLVPLLLLTLYPHVAQPADVVRMLFCCKVQVAVFGHETMTLAPEREIVRAGIPVV